MVLKDKAVLIIEDNFFLALSVCDEVEGLEGIPLGPVATAAEALQFLDAHEVSAAVIDYDLGDIEINGIVDRLVEKAIPVVIYSAREISSAAAKIPLDATIVRKPINPQAVVAKLVEKIRLPSNSKSLD